MDIRMRELLPTLVMISKINTGEKLIVRSKHISVDKRWGQGCRRLWDGEGREVTLQRLTDIYSEIREKVFFLLNEIDNNEHDTIKNRRNYKDVYRLLQSIANALGRSYKGIKNLMNTYSTDSNTEARLESIVDIYIKDIYNEIDSALSKKYKPDIFIFNNKHLTLTKYNVQPDNEHESDYSEVIADV